MSQASNHGRARAAAISQYGHLVVVDPDGRVLVAHCGVAMTGEQIVAMYLRKDQADGTD